jgi:DNA-binding transcriptional LysR family regulator
MNLRQLEYFVAIAEAGSLTAGAERLLVAQPSLSQQMRALEAEVGVPLLERLPRGIRLTIAGERFLPEARAALEHADRARRSARTAWDLGGGELHIATIASVAAGSLPAALHAWQQRYPKVELNLREFLHRRTMDDAVRDGYGDLAVGLVPRDWSGPVVELGWEQIVAILPEDDPLLEGDAVHLPHLADRKWVHYAAEHGWAEVADLCFAASGFSPRIAIRTSQVGTAPVLAAAGLGPALVPDTIVPTALRPLVRQLSPRRGRRIVAFSRERTPAADAFVEILRAGDWHPEPEGVVEVP